MITTAAVVVFSLLFNNVYTQTSGTQNSGTADVHKDHKEAGHVENEHYEIIVMKDDKRTDKWEIPVRNRLDTDPIKNISIAIDKWAHMSKPVSSTTFKGSGYQGLIIKHFINNKFLHEFNLAICSNNLPCAIVHYTIPTGPGYETVKTDFKAAIGSKCGRRC